MAYSIENEQLSIQIQTHGAELISVKNKATKQEYIWQADPKVWARHAPVLFPIVGKLHGDEYRLNGSSYHISQHGFARDKEFKCIQQENHQLSFELSADEETRQMYPFEFMLQIRYRLKDNRLVIVYEVENRGSQPMPFSIGAHPAFYCPAQIDHHWEEYQLLFERNETLERHLIEDGLRNGQTKQLLDAEHVLPLHRHLFEDDAVIFYNVESEWISIMAQSTGKKIVTVYCSEFPYLGIWQKLGADFYCIEPWCGLADTKGFRGEITQKEGIQVLNASGKFEISYAIEFH